MTLSKGAFAAWKEHLSEADQGIVQKLYDDLQRNRAAASQASHCRQYMTHLSWCNGFGNGPCTCERDEDYAELMRLLDAAQAGGGDVDAT